MTQARRGNYVGSEAKHGEALFDALEALDIVGGRAAIGSRAALQISMRTTIGVRVEKVIRDPPFLRQAVVHVVEDVKVLLASAPRETRTKKAIEKRVTFKKVSQRQSPNNGEKSNEQNEQEVKGCGK